MAYILISSWKQSDVMWFLQLIQFLCMCVHRMSTFLQILSITEFKDKGQIVKEKEEEQVFENMEVCSII